MAERKRNPGGWAACKRTLANWPVTGVIGLMKDLHDLSPENRAFLQTRLLPGAGAEAAASAVEKKLDRLATPSAVYAGRFQHMDMKRLVDQFEKGTDDPALVARVLVSDLESSCATLEAVGDHDPLVNHLLTVTNRLHKTLLKVAPAQLPPVVERLANLRDDYGRSFGYGVSDQLIGLAKFWTARASEPGATGDGDENGVASRPEPDF